MCWQLTPELGRGLGARGVVGQPKRLTQVYGVTPAGVGYLCALILAFAMSSSPGHLLLTSLGRLRLIGFLEGASLLVLLGIAMPLKYLAGQPAAVRYVGMAHGLLFVLYVLLVIQVGIARSWSFGKIALALLASIVPFGTFWADRRLFH